MIYMATPTAKSNPRSRSVPNLLSPPSRLDTTAVYDSQPSSRLRPPLPPRSPLRPPTRIILSASSKSVMPIADVANTTYIDPTNAHPFHFQNPSFTSLNVLLDSLTNSHDDPPPPESPPAAMHLSPMDNGEPGSSTSSLVMSHTPPISKRTHALHELLSSERAYASDLAFIRDIHIPLALGQQVPLHATPATPPDSSSSSSRTVSTSSDSSSTSSTTPPMTREDTKTIFSNVPELAIFSDIFSERLEEALGSVLEGGQGHDRVGKLFLDIIPNLEPPYKLYITRHPSAVAHLNALPQTPALTAYLARTRTLASSLTHAWDLPSLLIKPVQRLLKYPLLLAAIIDETPDSHEDKANLKIAKEKMEEVARSVNEGRRRWEVVKEVLSDGPKKKLNVATIARMKSLRTLKPKGDNEEAIQVERMERHLKMADGFVVAFAKAAVTWTATVKLTINHLHNWAVGFGKVIGLSEEQASEAFDAFVTVVENQLLPLCKTLEANLKDNILSPLARLISTTASPLRLLDAMNTLQPLHLSLLNVNVSKSRPPPALLEASQSYLALRGQLHAELPKYLTLLEKGIILSIQELAHLQTQFWADVRDRWSDLWEALRVDGEMNAGAVETLRVWWERWGDVDKTVLRLNIVHLPKKMSAEIYPERERPATVRSMLTGLEPAPLTPPIRSPASNVVNMLSSLDPSPTLSIPPPSPQIRNRGTSDVAVMKKNVIRRHSNESFQSGKSSKSGKSGKSSSRQQIRPDEFGEYPPVQPPFGRPVDTFVPSRVMPGGMPYSPSPQPPRSAPSASFSVPRNTSTYYDDDWERGRIPVKPSLRRKLTDTLLPSGSRPRSSSTKSMDASTSKRGRESTPSVPSFYSTVQSPSYKPPRIGWEHARAKYACRVIHPCCPPVGVSYYGFPFFELNVGDIFHVLREAGHPCTHEHLPLYVDDGEDCLLLVRDGAGNVGWALASFLIPQD